MFEAWIATNLFLLIQLMIIWLAWNLTEWTEIIYTVFFKKSFKPYIKTCLFVTMLAWMTSGLAIFIYEYS